MTNQEAFEIGHEHHRAGRFAQAHQAYHQILARDPSFPDALHMLGVLAIQAGQEAAGIQLLLRAAAIRPDFAATLFELGNRRRDEEKFELAVSILSQAASVCPGSAEAYFHLGNALWRAKRHIEATASLRRSIELSPTSGAAHNSLGLTLIAQDLIDEGIKAFHRAIALEPQLYEAYLNLGNALSSAGQARDALSAFRTACTMSGDPRACDNVLLLTNYLPEVTVALLRDEHSQWACRIKIPPRVGSYVNDRTPDRRLRIGYVSADFNAHPVVRFLLPLLRNHSRLTTEVFCYSNVAHADEQTAQVRLLADQWRDIRAVSDADAASMIGQDQIDILMDLSLHGEGNRLGIFALKPAPVQATWLGYVGTTGLSTIDYRLSDPHLDEPGVDPAFVERTQRLSHTFWCYEPPTRAPFQRPTPAATNGFTTFGCFNNFVKVNAEVLHAWARILSALPGSHIIIHSRPGSHCERALSVFAELGVDRSRVRFVGFLPTPQYMDLHLEIDVALDPFPFGGGTTSCDALWMGVPLISLKGVTPAGRAGTTLLMNLALPELIAHSVEDYVSVATRLGSNLPRLIEFHGTLQERMRRSPLTDGKAFAADMESAQRDIWRRWVSAPT